MSDKEQKKIKSTQSYLKISDIKADTLIMDDGIYCAVVAVSSTNFALKSQEEQNALIYGYQNFLNSLDFSLQILMQSRKMDVHVYLEQVRKIMEQQTNELLRIQTQEYIEFISKLIENSSIMNKNFYVIIPHSIGIDLSSGSNGGGFFSKLFGGGNKSAVSAASKKNVRFEAERQKLDQKVNTVIGGLSALGLKSLPMTTEQVTELVYNSYNFEAGPLIDTQRLEDIKLTKI
ncbi:MAG: hypothetical protein JWO40_826 [Candidatus Doudnabacteria bacterium]|nr:hypothetical protein [Candidatus Doudnabacteria bacterium]